MVGNTNALLVYIWAGRERQEGESQVVTPPPYVYQTRKRSISRVNVGKTSKNTRV